MVSEDKINLLARVAKNQSPAAKGKPVSILALAAASYGSQPVEDSTVPTGFDPAAAQLFESIVEGAYLVANADGVFDAEERSTFARVVTVACGGAVLPRHIDELVGDLQGQLEEDGMEKRIARLAAPITKPEHAQEVLRIAALLAQTSDDVSDVERKVLEGLAAACKLGAGAVDEALREVKEALARA
jgi:tellurite resistance protein